MRAILIDWLVEVHLKFKVCPRRFHSAILFASAVMLPLANLVCHQHLVAEA